MRPGVLSPPLNLNDGRRGFGHAAHRRFGGVHADLQAPYPAPNGSFRGVPAFGGVAERGPALFKGDF